MSSDESERRAEEAARRLGTPHCQQCKRLGGTEHVTLYGDPVTRGRFYMGVDFCPGCAGEFRRTQELVDEVRRVTDVVDSLSERVAPRVGVPGEVVSGVGL